MAYPANFRDAHRRHWNDAELLFKSNRWPNADQMYGLSAECGLKALMRRSRMPVVRFGVPKSSKHKKHVNELWPEFFAFVRGRIGGRYLHLIPVGNPFTNWSIGDRYAHSHHFRKSAVEPHRKAARRVYSMINTAKKDGVL